ncbi:SusC/RagA family TonB-linked outer membrane protein [Solitalea longa]|uniref:SusC/RagA family TonB-linked outer membrane protein n=1 Tax=Solitalea longa TaxID=2079460 RepID=A0A2S4ZZ74_9SPHI|nr:SusC/RagA family TonB-linked outer membrane protein [Solitalea longa]POY35630.1 SusC/RagA family TonB-linked outer membrane protein [Solitalea longa]
MKEKFTKFLVLLFSLATLTTYAQQKKITGTVTSKADGTPLPAVTVTVKGSSLGTQTDGDGKFSISVPENATLSFSYIGFKAKEVSVGASQTINVSLDADERLLNEVVVTALGIQRDAKALGYSAPQLKGEELTKSREANVINSLAGKVAGVRVSSQSGTLGGSSKIIIRGESGLGGSSQPLFVIDGMPIDNGAQQISTVAGAVPQGSAGADFGNRVGDINPEDIETMTVLKGAAATALYGARAKSGAIVISTKKGVKGNASVTFNSSVRMDDILKMPEFQNEYAQGVQGTYNIASTNGWGPKISDVQDKTFPNFLAQDVHLKAYDNNIKDFFQTGKTYINSLAFSGGNETGDYRFSYANISQTGIIPNQKYSKNNITLNAGKTIGKDFNIRTILNYANSGGDGRPVQSSNNPNVIMPLIYGVPRTVDMELLRNNSINPETGQQITLTPARNGNNPFWVIDNNNFSNDLNRFYGNAILSYKILNWLTVANNLGLDYYNEFRQGNTRNGTIGALTGNFFTANIFNRSFNNDFIATADTKITNDLSLKVIGGANVFENYYQRNQSDAQTLTVDQLYNFSNAATVTTTNTSNKWRMVGLYGDIGLSYKDYLFLNVTGRNDWSSTLPAENRSYFYPSVSSSFVFTELMPSNKWLNYGKLRASWANVGSGTDPYQLAFVYGPQSTAFAQYGYGSQFPFNGLLAFSIPSVIPNFNLKPQNQITTEIGADLRFLNNRVKLDVTYYNSKTDDQIIALTLPQSTGFTSKKMNAGSVTNKGFEVALGLVPVKTNRFDWNFDLNFSQNKQTTQLPSEVTAYTLQSGWSGLIVKTRSNESFGIFGSAWERDPNGNIVIDPATGLRKTKLDQRLGSINPDWMLGINNSINFKSFNLSFLIDVRQGGVVYSNTASSLRTSGLAKETLANRGNIFIDKGVVLQGTEYVPNTVPVQSMQDFWGQFSTTNTEANIFDASYVKLREVKFSYKIPSSILGKSAKFMKELEIGVEGRNLWIISDHVPHVDPEVNFFGPGSAADGIEFNSAPSTRSFGFNLRVKI